MLAVCRTPQYALGKLELDISQGESMFTKVSIITAPTALAMCMDATSADARVHAPGAHHPSSHGGRVTALRIRAIDIAGIIFIFCKLRFNGAKSNWPEKLGRYAFNLSPKILGSAL